MASVGFPGCAGGIRWTEGLRDSAARDHADDLEAVAALEIGFGPLGAKERGAVVFDEGGGEGEA